MSPIQESSDTLRLSFQTHAGATWDLGLPLLAGPALETLFPDSTPADALTQDTQPIGDSVLGGQSPDFSLFSAGDFLLGIAQQRIDDDLARASEGLYRKLLASLGNHSLCRVWNYVPDINAEESGGLENYRAFCLGRSLAFEAALGRNFEPRLSAASAVGTDSDLLTVAFAAHRHAAIAFENPLQVPAYHYPASYGPRPPSFARASVIPLSNGRRHVFLSGTAAIRGHLTVSRGDTAAQTLCTLENLAALGAHAGIGADLAAGRCAARWFKVYLRHAGDLELVSELLHTHLLHPDDQVCYLRSDICRADLAVEIEMSALDVHA